MPTIFQKVRQNHWTMKQLDSGGLIRRSRLSLFSCEAGEGSKITEDGQQKHRATPRQWRKSGEMLRKWAEMDRNGTSLKKVHGGNDDRPLEFRLCLDESRKEWRNDRQNVGVDSSGVGMFYHENHPFELETYELDENG